MAWVNCLVNQIFYLFFVCFTADTVIKMESDGSYCNSIVETSDIDSNATLSPMLPGLYSYVCLLVNFGCNPSWVTILVCLFS